MGNERETGTAGAWHALEIAQVMQEVGSREEGLTENEARERLDQHGPNLLKPPKRRSTLARLLSQFHNVLIYVLLGAGVITALLGHFVDSAVIVGVVLINGIIGFIQEGKAEAALDAVRKMLSPQATVIRDKKRLTLPAEQVVPGDLVFVQSGDRVPADLRLVNLQELRIDEALLTGESEPASKSLEPVSTDAALGDRRNLAFSGTLVTSGQGTGVVIGTGVDTEVGRISEMLAQVQTLSTPLMRQMATFGRWLTGAILALAGATFAFGAIFRDYAAGEMFLAAVGLAVAAIPEGLPAIITITLAIGVQRMARRNAIIRRLPAVETLGSVTVVCSDKTGTLTRNEMTVTSVATAREAVEVTGGGYDPHGGFNVAGEDSPAEDRPELRELCTAGLLCSEASLREVEGHWRVEGDPTEGALVALAMKASLEPQALRGELPRTDVIPFESEHRFMATLHHDHQGNGFIYLKGAPEAVLDRCATQRLGTETEPLDKSYWLRRIEEFGNTGQRTLAIAARSTDAEHTVLNFDDVNDGLTLLGIVGIIDPPRDEAIRAVGRCQEAGIRVKMITGDHAATAAAIAGQLGIGSGETAAIGTELEKMNDEELRAAARDVDVFARASPEHKLRLVTALQANGQIVAMTGDGVNDSPALKRADVGVAMGVKGTEAAKEAAEMVLADDNFASIAHAVEEGRTVYDNIKKAILFILPTNGGEALTVLGAIALGRVLPITPAQILWVNMITAVTLALALAFEPSETDVMRRPPRDPKAPMISGFMTWRIAFVSLLMVTATFGLFLWERAAGADVELARTVAVNTLVVGEAFYLFNTRFLTAPVLTPSAILGNRYMLIAVAVVITFQLAFTYLPLMQTFFATRAIGLEAWMRIVLVGFGIFVLVEIEKFVRRRLRENSGTHG